nr:MAG TPA: hypothetical protein [Caudoviricetes sp.]
MLIKATTLWQKRKIATEVIATYYLYYTRLHL